MRTPKHISSTAAALRAIFLPQFETRTTQLAFSPHTRPCRNATSLQTIRPFSNSPRHAVFVVTPKDAPKKSRLPRDHEIRSFNCILVSPEGGLSDPQSTRSLLSTINTKTHSLIQVAETDDPRARPPTRMPPVDSPEYASWEAEVRLPKLPIVKVVNKEDEARKEREVKKKKKEERDPGLTRKTLELNWAIEKGDESHRVETLRKFLGKGYKVDVVLAKKRKGKVVSEDVAGELVKRIRAVVKEEGKGWKEYKNMEGKVGGTVTIFCEGKLEKS